MTKERISYAELDKRIGGSILCNNMESRWGTTMEVVSGDVYKHYEDDDCEEDEYYEDMEDIYQYFFISSYGADYLKKYTDEIVFYDEELDVYVWGVTHFGTDRKYVYLDIEY